MLPCKHRYHVACIDQWLSSRKPLCPICKHDALAPLVVVHVPPGEAGTAEGPLVALEPVAAQQGALARVQSIMGLRCALTRQQR